MASYLDAFPTHADPNIIRASTTVGVPRFSSKATSTPTHPQFWSLYSLSFVTTSFASPDSDGDANRRMISRRNNECPTRSTDSCGSNRNASKKSSNLAANATAPSVSLCAVHHCPIASFTSQRAANASMASSATLASSAGPRTSRNFAAQRSKMPPPCSMPTTSLLPTVDLISRAERNSTTLPSPGPPRALYSLLMRSNFRRGGGAVPAPSSSPGVDGVDAGVSSGVRDAPSAPGCLSTTNAAVCAARVSGETKHRVAAA
eukprot:14978-Pelagococcus_subviridis.AAC.11